MYHRSELMITRTNGPIFLLAGHIKGQMRSNIPCTQYDLKETIQNNKYSYGDNDF